VFDAPRFELALYERSGGLIFGSYQGAAILNRATRHWPAALASGIGMLARSAACAASKRSQGYSLATRAAPGPMSCGSI